MRRWIEFNVNHPGITFSILLIFTILAAIGFNRLYFDSSTEALMPKESITYKLGQRAKEIFIDSRTFMLTAIEPAKGYKLFSEDTFSALNALVSEIEELKNFDKELEDKRLAAIMKAGNISVVSNKPDKKEPAKTEEKKDDLESELDRELLGEGGNTNSLKNKAPVKTYNIWDVSHPVSDKFYAKAIRKRNKYSFEKYDPVELGTLIKILDAGAWKQLKTVLRYNKMGPFQKNHILTKDEYKDILDTWETVYLYKSMEIVKSFVNPISGEDIAGTEMELKPVSFIPKDEKGIRHVPKSEEEFQMYKERLLRNPSFKNALYSIDDRGHIRALAMSIVLRPLEDHFEIFNYLYEIIEKYNKAPLVLTQAGMPVFQKFIKEYMKKDLLRFMPLVVLVVIFTFFLNFRSFRGVILPTISVLLGTFWTLGFMGLFNIPITLVVNMLPPLLIAVGSSYAIHIYNQYILDRELIQREGKRSGLIQSMSRISITVMLAALTTFVGFMTLTINQVTSLRDFGFFAAAGTFIAMLISSALIPSSLMLMKLIPFDKKRVKQSNYAVNIILNFFNRLTVKHSKFVVITSLILIIIFSFGITKIKVETSPLYQFKKDSYLYQSDIRISELFNGTVLMNLIIDSGAQNGAKDPGFLQLIEEIRKWILSDGNRNKYLFLHTLSFGDVIKRMNKAMNNENPEFSTIPDERSTITDYLELYSGEDRNSDGRVDTFEQFIDPQYRYVNVLIRVGSLKNKLFSTSINAEGQKRIIDYLEKHPAAKKYKYYFVGETVNFTILSDLIVRGQILSVLLTLLIVLLVIFLLFKNLHAGLISIIPISTSIILVYGIMGYLNIPLDIPKALLAAIAIGIGVDDTIHMLKTIRLNILKGYSIEESINLSYREAGMAIVYTSIALILGFSVLMLSEFVPVFYLGWLVASTMIATTIAALVLLPSVILLLKIPVDRECNSVILNFINFNKFFQLDNRSNGG